MRKFDRLYEADKAAQKEERKPLVERRVKRMFNAAFDSAEGQEIDAMDIKQSAMQDLRKLDVNCLLDAQAVIDKAARTKAMIAKEYEELFDEPLGAAE